ncbi:MAG: hypothetical protein AB1744_14605, partial [Candidatus Zixiibacteriota bacterium]
LQTGFIPAHTILQVTDNTIELQPGTKMALQGTLVIRLPENTIVTKPADNKVLASHAMVENDPDNWVANTHGSLKLQWSTSVLDNEGGKIPTSGNTSRSFPFAVTSPGTSGTYSIKVRARGTGDSSYTIEKPILVTVDATAPTVFISTSKTWAKGGENITITVAASETLSKLDNVRVAEGDGDTENNNWVQVTMTASSEENKVWTGTYVTSDNAFRDGQARIEVAKFQDTVGNEGTETDNYFILDRIAPAAIAKTAITSWPQENENKATFSLLIPANSENSYFIQGENILSIKTAKVRVGSTVSEATLVGGNFTYNLTLSDGISEVGVRLVDQAGNEGPENVDNVLVDTTKPSITITTPENGQKVNNNTPTFSITIADATHGIDNQENASGIPVFVTTDNHLWNRGWTVYIEKVSGSLGTGA